MDSGQRCCEKDHCLVICQEPLLSVLPQYVPQALQGKSNSGSYTTGQTKVICPIHPYTSHVSGSQEAGDGGICTHMYMQADGPTARTWGSERISSTFTPSSFQALPSLMCMYVTAGVRSGWNAVKGCPKSNGQQMKKAMRALKGLWRGLGLSLCHQQP